MSRVRAEDLSASDWDELSSQSDTVLSIDTLPDLSRNLINEFYMLARHPNVSMVLGAAAVAARRAGHTGAVVQFESKLDAQSVLHANAVENTLYKSLEYWFSDVEAVDACDDTVDALARRVRPATHLEVELACEMDELALDDKNVTAFYVGTDFKGAALSINRRVPCLGCTLWVNVKRCSGCLCAVYCSAKCQRDHWQDHKATCRWLKHKIELFKL
jgi:hypothetical protein